MANRYLAQEKRVFDISKFTVVGSPTITSDGVASGFSAENKLGFPVVVSSPFTLKYKFNTDNLDTTDKAKYGLQFYNGLGSIYFNKGNYTLTVSYPANDGTFKYHSLFTRNPNTDYELTYSIDGSSTFILVKDLTNNTEQTFNLPLYAENVNCTGFSVENFDCGHFYINTLKVEQNGKLIYTPTKPVHLLERRKPKVWNKGQFTIVGNPSISEDGVASGFSGANAVISNYYMDFTKTNWEILTPKFSISAFSQNNPIISNYDSSTEDFLIFVRTNGKISWQLATSKGGANIFKKDAPITLQTNTNYQLKITFDGSKYKLYLATENGTFVEIDSVDTNTISTLKDCRLSIGRSISQSAVYMTTDLKQFKIYTDNNLVFDGGAETYVYDPSKFTVVGSPTITDDGVASGFGSVNYIKTVPLNTISVNNFSISIGFTMGAKHQNTLFNSRLNGSTEYGIAIITNTNKIYGYASSSGTTWDICAAKIGTTTLVEGVKYLLTLSFNGSQYICKLLNQETGIETVEWTVDNNLKIYAGKNPIALGSQAWEAMSGSIDLKQFSITVDDKEVFTGAKENYYVLRS